MLQYYIDNPKYIFLLAALVLLTVFVIFKAAKASMKRSRENEKIINRLKEENKLRNEFAVLTDEIVKEAEPERLFKGVALNLQKRVADKEDMASEFESLEDWQKYVYALSVFMEDSETKMSDFFRLNTQPLTGQALRGMNVIIGGRLAEIFSEEFNQFDEENEEISLDESRISVLDGEASKLFEDCSAAKTVGEYIKSVL